MLQVQQEAVSVQGCRGEVRDCIEALRSLLGALPYEANFNQVCRHLSIALIALEDADVVLARSIEGSDGR